MANDFLVTRRTIDMLDGWLDALCAPLLPLQRVPEECGGFHWEFREQTPRTVQLGKAVRMVSGVRAALFLADAGFVVECMSLLRMVSEFSTEIIAISEALVEGRLTEDQERFIRQYFAPFAKDPDQFEKQDRERYVSREEVLKAHYRLSAKASVDVEEMRKLSHYLNYGYDKYVHGAYLTAMELFSDRTNHFMLRGHESEEKRSTAKSSVAGKLHEVVIALAFVAMTAGESELAQEIRSAAKELDDSRE